MTIEIESLKEFDEHIRRFKSLKGCACQGLDLVDRTWALIESEVIGAFFLGCRLESNALKYLNDQGAVVFPPLLDLPFRPFRSRLYTVDELYDQYRSGQHETYDATLDALAYRSHNKARASDDVVLRLAERIHDHAIDDALNGLLSRVGEQSVVAVMGGHGLTRTDDLYAAIARLGRALTRAGYYVATGGGPGAMEAANLGAWLAGRDDDELDEALMVLGGAARFSPVGDWLDAAFKVRSCFPLTDTVGASLGVPTWHYGHEPPNVFATEIAKYFANSIREEGLLAIAKGGVVFAPGSAGTIQEVFQDAAQNHYETFGEPSPMVFLGRKFWTETTPVYPLLAQLANRNRYADMLAVTDEPEEAVAFLKLGSSLASQAPLPFGS